MNKLTQFFLISILFTTILAFGQSNNQTTEEKPYIEVVGKYEMEIIPDEIFIKIVIHEKYESRTKITIQEQEDSLKVKLKSIGIDLSNLYLNDVNADFVKISWSKKDVLTKKDYTLKVSDAAEVKQVFQELENLQITDASISKVSHSKIDSLRKVVRIKAIKAAKEKAEYLLAAIDEQIGKPLIIRENMPQYYSQDTYRMNSRSNYSYMQVGGVSSSYGDKELEEIEFQKINLSTSIYIKFLIN